MVNSHHLTIAIPTYNRQGELAYNLTLLADIILAHSLENQVKILISNNASPDMTKSVVEQFASAHESIYIDLFNQPTNIGIQRNTVFLLEKSTTPYVMILGDDDYISDSYLLQVLQELANNPSIGCIIPSYQNIKPDTSKTNMSRDLNVKSKCYKKGFRNALRNSWRGHQLSGLVFLREYTLDQYNKFTPSTLYPFIFFALVNTLHGDCLHLTQYPVLVTQPGMENKTWGYGSDGLMNDIFSNYIVYTPINKIQVGLLQLKFLDVQYWRYAMYMKLGIGKFLHALWNIITAPNTVHWIRFVIPFAIPFILIKRAILLLFSGKLLQTLKTSVKI